MPDLSQWEQVILSSGLLTEETWRAASQRYEGFLAENPGIDFSVIDYLLEFDYLTEAQSEALTRQMNASPVDTAENAQDQAAGDRDFGQVVIEFDDSEEADEFSRYKGNAHGHPEAAKARDFELPDDEMIDLADESESVAAPKTRHPDAVNLSAQARDELLQDGDIEQLDLADEDEDPAGVHSQWKYDATGQFVQNPDFQAEKAPKSPDEQSDPAPFIEDDGDEPLELNVDPEKVAGYQGKMSEVDWVDTNETDQSEYRTSEEDQIDLA